MIQPQRDEIMQAAQAALSPRTTLVIAGLGNIGSAFVGHVPYIPGIRRVILVDPDVYEEKNLCGQQILPGDVGRAKALVMAKRLRPFSHLEVIPVVGRFEDLPLSHLRNAYVVSCLDSRGARQYASRAAWRMGVPFIDGAVEGTEGLARVNVYMPDADLACMECAWDERHYGNIEQRHACGAVTHAAAPTNAPVSLGALTAACQALQVEALARGALDEAVVSRQIMFDTKHHTSLLTRLGRHPGCHFDHAVADIALLDTAPADMAADEAFALSGPRAFENATDIAIAAEMHYFVSELACPQRCDRVRFPLRLERSVTPARARCRGCRQPMLPVGTGTHDLLWRSEMKASDRRRSMAALGFRAGDVFTVVAADGYKRYFAFNLTAGGRNHGV